MRTLSRHRWPRVDHRALAAAIVVVLVATLAACSALNGGDDQPATSAANRGLEKPTIRVGVIQILDAAPFYLAQARGYFAAEGLTVQVAPVRSGTDVLPMLASHTLDIGLGNWATLFQAEANKVGDYRIVADGAQGRPHVMIVAARPDSGIHGPKDLVGKTVSTNAPNDVPKLALKAVLQANGIDPGTVKTAVVQHPDTPAALANKLVDAAIQVEPFITLAHEQTGTEAVVDLFGPGVMHDLPIAGYFSLAAFTKANPKTAAAFQRAMQRGAADAASDQAVRDILPSYAPGIDKGVAQLVTTPTFPTSLSATRLQRVADLMQTYGQLSAWLDVAPMIFTPHG